MAEHTPTPWEVTKRVSYYGIRSIHGRGGGGDLRLVATCATPHADAGANAAFIVKAVNHHDALVSALTELYAQVKGECPSLLNEDSGGDGTLDIEIQTLLAAVVGGSGT